MQGVWLGQAGFLFTAPSGATVMIDPYLSNSLEERRGAAFHREVPIRREFLQPPDILVLTHCHEDHCDFGTLDQLFGARRMTVLAPAGVFPLLRERYPEQAEFVLFTPGTEVTLGPWALRAVFAAHSDPGAVGVVLSCGGKQVYHMGDTLYHRRILSEDVRGMDLLLLPVNGRGNNMNAADAARMARALSPAAALPMHWDMFRSLGGGAEDFAARLEGPAVLLPRHYEYFTI